MCSPNVSLVFLDIVEHTSTRSIVRHTCNYVRMYVCMCICMDVYMYVYMCMFVCMYVYVLRKY